MFHDIASRSRVAIKIAGACITIELYRRPERSYVIFLLATISTRIRDSTGYSEFQFRRDPIFCKSVRRRHRTEVAVSYSDHEWDSSSRYLDSARLVAYVCSGDLLIPRTCFEGATLPFVMCLREKEFTPSW